MTNTPEKQDPQAVNFGAILQGMMLDYEQLADAHNILVGILFSKGIITHNDWKEAQEKMVEEKKKMKNKVAEAMSNNGQQKSQIIKP